MYRLMPNNIEVGRYIMMLLVILFLSLNKKNNATHLNNTTYSNLPDLSLNDKSDKKLLALLE